MKRKIEAKKELIGTREALVVSGLSDMDITDTLECGQAFRYEELCREDGYVEYLTVAMGRLIFIGQRKQGELIFYGMDEEDLPMLDGYFCLSLDYPKIREIIASATDSDWLMRAAESGKGIHILKQDSWEALFSHCCWMQHLLQACS